VIERTAQAMRNGRVKDPQDVANVRALGVIDLPTIQKKLNLHYSLSLDLFGSEVSTNSANFFNSGVKGRFRESRIADDHRLTSAIYPVLKLVDGAIQLVDEPALTALNMRLRDDYIHDCAKGVERWNRILEKGGVDFRLQLPHVAFNRAIGQFKDMHADPDGKVLSAAQWAKTESAYLPSAADGDFINSLMAPEMEPGRFASWIAPPKSGIDNKSGDFEYVKIESS
jgi:benzoyl-CoA 2,3-epoxidase subunit B